VPISIDGNSLILTDCDITFTNAFDPKTGVSTITITPAGGLSNLPALLQGTPGLPPVIDSTTAVEYAPGATIPPNTTTVVSPGGAGTASHYTITYGVHRGNDGLPGTNSVLTAIDLSGPLVNGYQITYNAAGPGALWAAPKVGGLYVPASIAATASSASSPRTLIGVAVPAQAFDWWPIVNAQCCVIGASDTRIDLVARLNNATSGDIVGYGSGVTGAAPPPVLINGSGYGGVLTGSYGKVLAGQAATIYLVAVQVAASSNSWSTAASSTTSPSTQCMVEVRPVP